MNARQRNKVLKKQIKELQSDNDLMKRLIANSPTLQEIYGYYRKPLNVIHSTMNFEQYRSRTMIPNYIANNDIAVKNTKEMLAMELFEAVKKSIIYKVDTKGGISTGITEITASIFIGRKY